MVSEGCISHILWSTAHNIWKWSESFQVLFCSLWCFTKQIIILAIVTPEINYHSGWDNIKEWLDSCIEWRVVREFEDLLTLFHHPDESRLDCTGYIRWEIVVDTRLCWNSFVHMDIQVLVFLVDILNWNWLISSFILIILKVDDLCLFVFCDMDNVLSNWNQFACLREGEKWRKYASINIEMFHERMDWWTQTESYPVDKDCIGSLRIIIIFFKLDGFLSYLFKFGDDFLLGQVLQDLHFVDFQDLRKEFLSCSSTSLSICVDVNWSVIFNPQWQLPFIYPFCS